MNSEQMRELADALRKGTHYVDSPELHEAMLLGADFLRQCAEQRPCTCHPDDNPPVPCAQQYALNECRAEVSEPTEAQIEYEILCNGEWVAGASGEGAEAEILHYLTQYEEDGPCEVYAVTRRLVDRAALAQIEQEKANGSR